MTRQAFDQELQRLQDDVIALGSMVGDALVYSVDVLKRRDFDASRAIIEQDREVNRRRFAIENDVLTLIATQQPMAGDMRMLAAILEIGTELERMGDYAKGIARINLMIGEQPLIKPLIDLPIMADIARDMLDQALKAFMDGDDALARSIPRRDDEIDDLYQQVYHELLTFIIEDRSVIEQSNLLMWVAHNLERTADRVINLCERVVYMVTGELEELNSDSGVESVA
ncbi:MAG TPA: phosphate signaling complex protein PhoU [Anaerolineae bacterium]|nr:phosphate signaling complex protein PhoU [Anaerolineae bacterium]